MIEIEERNGEGHEAYYRRIAKVQNIDWEFEVLKVKKVGDDSGCSYWLEVAFRVLNPPLMGLKLYAYPGTDYTEEALKNSMLSNVGMELYHRNHVKKEQNFIKNIVGKIFHSFDTSARDKNAN